VFGSGTAGTSDSKLAINGHSSAAGGFVCGSWADGDDDGVGVEAEAEATPDTFLLLGSFPGFVADRFLARERKGKRDVFWVLAFRRAGSAAVGSSSGCINRGKRGFEEDEVEVSVMAE